MTTTAHFEQAIREHAAPLKLITDEVAAESHPQPLALAINTSHDRSSDEQARLEEVVEDLRAWVQAEASEQLAAVVEDAAARIAAEFKPLEEARDRQISVFQSLARDLMRTTKRLTQPLRETLADAASIQPGGQHAWSSVARSAVSALLDSLVAQPDAGPMEARDWAQRTVTSIRSDRFFRATGVPAADVPRVLEASAHAVVQLWSTSVRPPRYYRDRWGDIDVTGDAVEYRATKPTVLVRVHGSNTAEVEDLCGTEPVELIPVGEPLDVVREWNRLSLVPLAEPHCSALTLDVEDAGDVSVGAHSLRFRCEGLEQVPFHRWTSTPHGVLGERYIAEKSMLDKARSPRVQPPRESVGVAAAVHGEALCRFIPPYVVHGD